MKLALVAVLFANATHGYAVSQAHSLYTTSDAGRHWRLAARHVLLPPTYGFYAKQLGRGVYAVVHNGRRAGVIRDARGDVPQFDRVDDRRIYAWLSEGAAAGSSAQALFTSADSGRTWRFVSRTDVEGTSHDALPFGCDKTGVGFATATRGFATAYCAGGPAFLYRTGDGGRTWRKLTLPGLGQCACGTQPPRFFSNGEGAFAIDGFVENGGGTPLVRVFWTHDGGLHWRATQAPAGRLTGTVQIPSARTAWFVGGAPHDVKLTKRYLFRTTDGGESWQRRRLPFDASSVQLDAVNDTVAFALTPTRLWRTADGGVTWR